MIEEENPLLLAVLVPAALVACAAVAALGWWLDRHRDPHNP